MEISKLWMTMLRTIILAPTKKCTMWMTLALNCKGLLAGLVTITFALYWALVSSAMLDVDSLKQM